MGFSMRKDTLHIIPSQYSSLVVLSLTFFRSVDKNRVTAFVEILRELLRGGT